MITDSGQHRTEKSLWQITDITVNRCFEDWRVASSGLGIWARFLSLKAFSIFVISTRSSFSIANKVSIAADLAALAGYAGEPWGENYHHGGHGRRRSVTSQKRRRHLVILLKAQMMLKAMGLSSGIFGLINQITVQDNGVRKALSISV